MVSQSLFLIVLHSITSSFGSTASTTPFDGSAVEKSTIDGYLITETLASPISMPATVTGTAHPMITIELNNVQEEGVIMLLANDSTLVTT